LYLRSFNRFLLINLALLGFSISSASAALTSADWKSVGDDLLTIDDSGLQWLDLSETVGLSYNAVAAQLVAGGEFEGFRYATVAEVEGLWNSAGGDDAFYNGWSAENNGVFDVLAPYWGDSLCIADGCATGTGYAWTLVDLTTKNPNWHATSIVHDCRPGTWQCATMDFLQSIKDDGDSNNNQAFSSRASALVRVTPVPLDHFSITPATTSASTCLANAITIIAEDAFNNPVLDYTNLVSISVSTSHGNWSINNADGTLSPNPDTDDNGAVSYTFVDTDDGNIVLDLSNTHAESLIITVNDVVESVSSISELITFSENTFIITEDPIQIAGRPQLMSIAMWKNDPGNGFCGIDTNYNSATQSLEASVTRTVALPVANAPIIVVGIPDAPATIPVVLDFSVTPGQTSFDLLTTDVGQYRLNFQDTTLVHSDVNIIGVSAELTVRPFGLAVTNITGLIPNPGNTGSGGAIFALAGTDFSATVEAVLWDIADDTNDDGVLDTGIYADNVKAPSYAWATTLGVPSPAMGFTPTAGPPQNGVQGSFINGALVPGDFIAGTASPANLQYDEVGSFTLQSSAVNYLGTIGADFVGDDIIVGRFRPASFNITATQNGMFANSCTLPLSPYTYIGESFTYDLIHPSFEVTAMNGLAVPTPTTNYTGDWAKLDDDSVTFTQPTADLTQDGSVMGTKMAVSYTQDAAKFTITDNTNGSFTFEFADDTYVYDRDLNSEIPDFDSDITLLVTDVTDLETVTNTGSFNLNPSFINLRFGRVKMSNAHGSELFNLAMPMIVEYLDSPGLYTLNTDDVCTTIATANLGITDNLSTPGSSTVTVTNTTAVGGNLGVTLTAPGAGITGYIDVTVDLAASLDSWLQYDWTLGAGAFNENPTARATFGIYSGNDVNIYKSQTYQ
jgi:MSHA biogenesis protein MshQ